MLSCLIRPADTNGAPITNTVNMVFRLYAAATGGAPLCTEQWTGSNTVQVSDGLFNVMLGSLTPIPQSLVTSHSSLYLGITVGTDDEMSPRVQLGSVPWAVQALTVPDGSVTTAKIADGAVTSAKLGNDVNLLPPTGSITTMMLADGAVTVNKVRFDVPELVYGGTGFANGQCLDLIPTSRNLGYKSCAYASSSNGYAVWHGNSACSDPAATEPTVHQRHTIWTLPPSGSGTPTYILVPFADQYPQLICTK